jgi:predicted dehydrogenase
MSGDMKVLLVGTGPMAIAYGRVLNALSAAWSAVGRGSQSAAQFEAATGREPVLGGLDAYLDTHNASVDAAIVALPVHNLVAAAISLLDAGTRRILVEKPAGLNADDIEDLARVAARTGADVFVAYNRRFYASVAAARRLIAEDGGVTSFHMEFTELADRVAKSVGDRVLLSNWFLANSTHVVDLAFHLGGKPAIAAGLVTGGLDWHPQAACFAGHGRTKKGAVFSWHADWSSAGRWGLDLRTPHRRLILQPLETLTVQEKGGFAALSMPIDDELDGQFKPGLYRQVEAFLSDAPTETELLTIAAHSEMVGRWYGLICPPPTASPFACAVNAH